jgi:hypothetical protein
MIHGHFTVFSSIVPRVDFLQSVQVTIFQQGHCSGPAQNDPKDLAL